ncbi:hypothetical protein BSL78_22616 [Apostichopus japonicus]|uniref:CCHC-type domain-containing protein n=1 Tax=Stichopus japonicus TaxID=307972 RepID=A0A2G8JXS1_STIJA|nr:hypothetical protein BSL78_22616 [Apostichopus japonicus]
MSLPGTSGPAASGAQPSQADLAMMSQFFRRAMSFQGIPHGRLQKFTGPPYRAGELSLLEWLEEFETIVSPFNPTGEEKARQLIEHLGGAAKEEVKCMGETERNDYDEIVAALKMCFGAHESVQSLRGSFHNRVQQEQESLSDFSRALKRLYSKMEMAAPTDKEKNALRHLRDGALRSQFVQGARDTWVRRELRRIDMATNDKSFDVMRQEVLTLFQESEQLQSPVRMTRAREAQVELQKEAKPDQIVPDSDLLAGQKNLADAVERLSGELATIKSKLPGPSRTPLSEIVCFKCNSKGHIAANCRSRQGDTRPGSNRWAPQPRAWHPQQQSQAPADVPSASRPGNC